MSDTTTPERRKPLFEATPKQVIPLLDRMSIFLVGFHFTDILSTRHHSEDFNDTRSQFIVSRIRLMSYIFALLVPICIFIDLILLQPAQAELMLYARIGLSILLILLAQSSKHKTPKLTFNVLLPFAFILPTIFYITTTLILAEQNGNIGVGY